MAQPIPIVADPISSDGSEESWILLDEMDEAMREEFNGGPNVGGTKNERTTTTNMNKELTMLNESNLPEIEMAIKDVNDDNDENDNDNDIDVPLLGDEEQLVDYPSNVDILLMASGRSISPSNGYEDDINVAKHCRY